MIVTRIVAWSMSIKSRRDGHVAADNELRIFSLHNVPQHVLTPWFYGSLLLIPFINRLYCACVGAMRALTSYVGRKPYDHFTSTLYPCDGILFLTLTRRSQ